MRFRRLRFAMAICLYASFANAVQRSATKSTTGGPTPPSMSTGNPTVDIIPTNFASEPFDNFPSLADPSGKPESVDDLEQALSVLTSAPSIYWNKSNIIYQLATSYQAPDPANLTSFTGPKANCAPLVTVDQGYLFHVKHWTAAPNAAQNTLVSSAWFGFRRGHFERAGSARLLRSSTMASGDPLFYGTSVMLVVEIDIFDKIGTTRSGGALNTSYTANIVQGTPQNFQNLSALAQALGGFASPGFSGAGAVPSAYIGVGCENGTKQLPYNVTLNEQIVKNTGDKPPAQSTSGNISCSNASLTPCTGTRTFAVMDREYWDVSLGLAIPGVRETSFSFNTSSSATSHSVTTHTELYAFIDVYPLAYYQPKESFIPHVNLGVPVTTKSLYRPYFGLSEDITSWTGLQKLTQLPTSVDVFAGMVFMKTQQLVGAMPTTQAEFTSQLKYHHVWKPMFGIEVPVGSLASKIGKSGSSGKNANGAASGSKSSGT